MPEIDPGYLQINPETGLSTQEAAQRQKKFGLNRIEIRIGDSKTGAMAI
jgi:hypothetical protein